MRKKRGNYLGGGTIIGPGRPWHTEPTYDETNRLTEFEQAVLEFVKKHKDAKRNNRQLPEIPDVIRRRYPDSKKLKTWLKSIVRTDLYKSGGKSLTKNR
jgi:hypothetical protein